MFIYQIVDFIFIDMLMEEYITVTYLLKYILFAKVVC